MTTSPALTIVTVFPLMVAMDRSPEVYENAPADDETGSIIVYVPPFEKTNVSTLKSVMTGGPVTIVNVAVADPTVKSLSNACDTVIVVLPTLIGVNLLFVTVATLVFPEE